MENLYMNRPGEKEAFAEVEKKINRLAFELYSDLLLIKSGFVQPGMRNAQTKEKAYEVALNRTDKEIKKCIADYLKIYPEIHPDHE